MFSSKPPKVGSLRLDFFLAVVDQLPGSSALASPGGKHGQGFVFACSAGAFRKEFAPELGVVPVNLLPSALLLGHERGLGE